MSTSPTDKVTTTPEAAGAHSGAVTGALLCFVALIVPTAVNAGAVGWHDLLVYILCFTVLAAVLGCVVGEIAARRRYVWAGALVGAALSASIALAFMFVFTWPGLPLFAGSIGAVSGGVAWRVANHQRDPERDRMRQVSLIELLVLVAAVAAHLAAYTV